MLCIGDVRLNDLLYFTKGKNATKLNFGSLFGLLFIEEGDKCVAYSSPFNLFYESSESH